MQINSLIFGQRSVLAMFVMLMAGMLLVTSCNKKDDDIIDDDDNTPTGPREIVEISGNLLGDVTWTADKIYRLNGYVRVGADDGTGTNGQQFGTLTIEPGTLIIGDRQTKGTLIVQRGSRIYAEGTPEKPIVMTSERAPGLKEPGDWGGLVIVGRASNNQPGGVAELEGQYGAFYGGGSSPIEDDNSGIVRYVRIEYAGVPINPNQEVNSLTMGSVGSGTTLEYIMCSYGLDDAFEWFGGTVNGKYLIAYKCLDDDLDVDHGYSGYNQFALVIRDKALADQSGSNGFEVDNDGGGTNATPYTAGTFSNVTIIGPKANRETAISLQYQNGMHLRRNNKVKIHNTFLTGFPNGIFIQGGNTASNAANDELVLRNIILAAVENWGGNGFGSAGTMFVNDIVGTEVVDGETRGRQHPNAPRGHALPGTDLINGMNHEEWFLQPQFGNQILTSWTQAGIHPDIFEPGTPPVLPQSGSMLLSGANFDGLPAFFERVNFIGAFGTHDWTQGWAEWLPQSRDYLNE